VNDHHAVAIVILCKGIIMKSKLFAATVTALALTVAGCANMRPMQIGATQADVRASLGAPSLQLKTSSGERWAYSTAPEGKLTWMYDFDAAGRVVSRTQALTIDGVARIKNGQTRDEVEALIGPSYWSLRYPFKQEEWVHVYRFDDVALPMCFYVGFDAGNVVVSTGMQEEIRSALRVARPC
jgi:outer membrane protein assembly factor BamE (lipoprotein component of BamABCDE complex)